MALIQSNFHRPKLRFGQSVYPRGVGGRGGVPILPLILNILDGLVANKTVLYRRYAHICWTGSNEHLPQKEAATRVGIAALLFLRLIPVYALEVYWTARVRGEFESLVTCEFRFGKLVQPGIFSDGEIAKPRAG